MPQTEFCIWCPANGEGPVDGRIITGFDEHRQAAAYYVEHCLDNCTGEYDEVELYIRAEFDKNYPNDPRPTFSCVVRTKRVVHILAEELKPVKEKI